jgi:hypothetical protein
LKRSELPQQRAALKGETVQGCQMKNKKNTKKWENLHQMIPKLPNGFKIHQHFPFRGPPKYINPNWYLLNSIWQPCNRATMESKE